MYLLLSPWERAAWSFRLASSVSFLLPSFLSLCVSRASEDSDARGTQSEKSETTYLAERQGTSYCIDMHGLDLMLYVVSYLCFVYFCCCCCCCCCCCLGLVPPPPPPLRAREKAKKGKKTPGQTRRRLILVTRKGKKIPELLRRLS